MSAAHPAPLKVVPPGGVEGLYTAQVGGKNVPISMLYGREDFLAGIPGDVPTPERHRAAAAVEACGLTWFEAQQLVNATEGPAPDQRAELDLDELWGDDADANIRLVNGLLTRLRTHDEELHNRLLPFIQRARGMADLVLRVAKRHERA